LHEYFARFGLLMHAGTTKADGCFEKLKTKAMYFPASPKILKNSLTLSFLSHSIYLLYTTSIPHKFCNWVGYYLTASNLGDDQDILIRIHKAAQQVGALTCLLLRNKAVGVFTKCLSFLVIVPVNTILHGCESWALKAEHL
jgi:hypothetical protein